MSESTVSLSHLVHVLFTLESSALVVEGVNDFSGQFVRHSLAAALASIRNQIFH